MRFGFELFLSAECALEFCPSGGFSSLNVARFASLKEEKRVVE